MVGITVALSATVGTMVLGFENELGERAPQAAVDFEFDGGTVTVTHAAGAPLPEDRVEVVDTDTTTDLTASPVADDRYEAGDVIASGPVESGETVRVVWVSADGEHSVTVGVAKVP